MMFQCKMNIGYLTVVGAVILHLTLGNLSTSGNLLPYLASYMRVHVSPLLGHAELEWVGAAGQIAFGLFTVLGGRIEAALGTKVTCAVGSIILSYGILLSSSTVQTSLPLLALTYGLTVGLGTSVAYCPAIYAAMDWFPNKEGLVSGVVLAGYSFGYMGATLLQVWFLNPDNSQSNRLGYFESIDVLNRVPAVFMWMALWSVVIQVVGILLISRPSPVIPPWTSYLPLDESASLLPTAVKREQEAGESSSLLSTAPILLADLSPREVIRKKLFRWMWLNFLANSVVSVSLVTTFKSFGATFISDDFFISSIGSIGAIANAGGSIFWGCLMDKTSYKNSMLVITILLTVGVGTLPLVPLFGKTGFVIWGLGLYFVLAGNYSLMPAVIKKAFGPTHAVTNVGIIFMAQGFAAVFVAVGMQVFLDRVSYVGCYVAQAFLPAMGFCITMNLPDSL